MKHFYSFMVLVALIGTFTTSIIMPKNKKRAAAPKSIFDSKIQCKLCRSECKHKEGLIHVPEAVINEQVVPATDIFFKLKGKHTAHQPTLVFLHFLEGSTQAFACQQEEFCKKYRTLAIDLRGRGKSSKTNLGDITNQAMAYDLNTVLRQLDIKGPLIVIGNVSGGFVALKYFELFSTSTSALFDPERTVSKLVFINSGPGLTTGPDCAAAPSCNPDGTTGCVTSTTCPLSNPAGPDCCLCFPFTNLGCAAFNFFIKPSLDSNYLGTACAFAQSVFQESCVEQVAQAKLRFVQDWLDTTAAIQENLYLNALAEDLRAVVSTIKIPTMVTYGDISPTPAGASLYLHDNISTSFLVKFAQKGEQPQITDFKNFNALLGRFIEGDIFPDVIDVINPECCVCPLYKPTLPVTCPTPDTRIMEFLQKKTV
jgi:pimeloyl-ACP methyl ester carboxylesterase